MIKIENIFVLIIYLLSTSNQSIEEKEFLIYSDNSSFIFEIISQKGQFLRYLASVDDDETVQGMISVANPNLIYVEYVKMLVGSLLINPEPEKVLIIGLGVGILAKTLDEILRKNATIDVV